MKDKLTRLPEEPGVYLMYDTNKTVIYVGKALNLKNRVKSYFSNSFHDNKTTHLVANIHDFDYIITNSEQEAFLLEANLIKQYQPRYNIIMKDDKRYPYIKINTTQNFPTIEMTRDLKKDGSQYFGPYTDVRHLRRLLRDLEWVFPHKTCNRVITEGNTDSKRACLNLQLRKCPGPCIGKITKIEYADQINKISKYLLGKNDDLLKELKAEMEAYADNLQFEKAARIRDKIIHLDTLAKKQHVYFNDLENRDVIALYKEENHVAVTILNMINGKINNKEVFSFKNTINETPEDILRAFLLQYYEEQLRCPHECGEKLCVTMNNKELPYQILLQITPTDYDALNILFKKKLIIPSKGEYKQLIEICRKNAFDYIENLKLQYLKKTTRTIIPIQEIKEFLSLKKLPRKIICLDVSTIQGSETVSSIVFFENGKPLKKQYRHFIIKTVDGQDDFASIAETLNRYFSQIIKDNSWEIPDLIIVDGGKGQLSSAANILKHFQSNHENLKPIEMISLAKRLEEVFLIGHSDSIIFPKTSSAIKLITRIRDEAHRFAITHHRKRRSNRIISSKLDEIKGLGDDKKFALLKTFGSVENIKNASADDLKKIKGIGDNLSEIILRFLNGI